jgi:hypothetical protein
MDAGFIFGRPIIGPINMTIVITNVAAIPPINACVILVFIVSVI